jgi:hypothetical protein
MSDDTVYYTEHKADVYHTDPDCRYLQRAAETRTCDRADAERRFDGECAQCEGYTPEGPPDMHHYSAALAADVDLEEP